MSIDAIMIKPNDNVATALKELVPGDLARVGVGEAAKEVLIRETVAYGHKFATRDIMRGENIIKYGEVMGRAIVDIGAGFHAHIQNIESLRGRGDLGDQRLK